MSVNVAKLDELDIDSVQQNHDLLRAMVQEDNPQIDVRRGVFDDLVNYYGAALATVNQENIDRLKRSQSLLEIEADPTLADDDVVDAVLSNFLIERKAGSAAAGSVTIVVSRLVSTTIAAGAQFTANGHTFSADTAYVARTDAANVQADTDRLLTEISDGNYAFNIDVTADDVGSEGRISKNTAVVPTSPPPNYVEAYAASDFTGGEDVETNEDLLVRLQEGVAIKALSGRTTMQASLHAREEFSGVLDSSIIGMGDAEMTRDRHWIWPTSGGGRVDWYVRTQDRPQQLTLTKQATLVSVSDNAGVWQFSISKADAPGFYDVVDIVLDPDDSTTGGFSVVADTRSYDLTGDDEFVPDITTAQEGCYSKYQTAVIQFEDTETPVSGLTVGTSKQTYYVTVRVMPLIEDIQDAMGERDTRNAAADLLVKAPIPCFLSLSMTVDQVRSREIAEDDIRVALATYVNYSGFPGRLYAAALTKLVQNLLGDGDNVGNIDMFARIRRPDGTNKYIRSDEVLIIPDEPENLVTAKTAVFILEPADIGISLRTVGQ